MFVLFTVDYWKISDASISVALGRSNKCLSTRSRCNRWKERHNCRGSIGKNRSMESTTW